MTFSILSVNPSSFQHKTGDTPFIVPVVSDTHLLPCFGKSSTAKREALTLFSDIAERADVTVDNGMNIHFIANDFCRFLAHSFAQLGIVEQIP